MIKKIKLGTTGESLSQYCLGTMMMGTALDQDDSFEILDNYVITHGGNFIDTANNYAWWMGTGEYNGDESESMIGLWLQSRQLRKDLFIATKVGARQKDPMAIRDANGIPRWDEIPYHLEGASAKTIRVGLNASLQRLKVDYIDLYYIHVDDKETDLEETLGEMNALIEEGKIRYYGYSNIQTWRLEQVYNICEKKGWIKPVAIQLEYSYISPAMYKDHPLGTHAKEDFFDWLATRDGASLVAYSPLMKGVFSDDRKLTSLISRPDYNTAYTKERVQKIRDIASKLNVSPNALVLAWMASREEGIFPLLGFSKLTQYQENIDCFTLTLEEDILQLLNE